MTSLKKQAIYIIFLLLMTVLVCLYFFPLYILFKVAFSAPIDLFSKNPPYLIQHFTWQHFTHLLTSGTWFWQPILKSVIVALGTTGLSVLIAAPAAYAISRLEPKWRMALMIAIFTSRMLPEISIALPITIRFIKWGLFDTPLGLILAHMIKTLPVCCFILVNVFSQYPKDIIQQAKVDGCSEWSAFHKIVLPSSITSIAVAGMFAFLLSWDEFIYASYLTLKQPTMPLRMYYYVTRGNTFHAAAYAVMILVPVLIITLFMQKHIKAEYMAGAIKE